MKVELNLHWSRGILQLMFWPNDPWALLFKGCPWKESTGEWQWCVGPIHLEWYSNE